MIWRPWREVERQQRVIEDQGEQICTLIEELFTHGWPVPPGTFTINRPLIAGTSIPFRFDEP